MNETGAQTAPVDLEETCHMNHKYIHRVLSLLLILCLLLGALPGTAIGIEVTVTDFEQLRTAINNFNSNAVADTTIIIGADLTMTSSLTILNKYYILTIKSDDTVRTLKRGYIKDSNTGIINVSTNAKLVIEELIIDGDMENYADNAIILVKISSGSFTMKEGAVLENNSGPGVDLYGGEFTMFGGRVSNNVEGGVFVSRSGRFTMEGGIISNNGGSGGKGGSGVICYFGVFTMIGGKITNNTSVHSGGGINLSYSSCSLSGGEITNNTARNFGGGVYIDNNSTLLMEGGKICKNTTRSGGGVCNAGTFTLKSGIIGENRSAGGGGIYNTGKLILEGGEISENAAEYEGGGIAIIRGSCDMIACEINNNTAESDGGGVYMFFLGVFTMFGGKIINNTAVGGNGSISKGGGVHLYLAATFIMEDGIISNNSADDGGGVSCQADSEFIMKNGKISENMAENNGGGVNVSQSNTAYYVYGKTFTMIGGKLENNYANNKGNGLYWDYIWSETYAERVLGTVSISGTAVIGTATDGNAITRAIAAQIIGVGETGLSDSAYINIEPHSNDIEGAVIATKQGSNAAITYEEARVFHYLGDLICKADGSNVILSSVGDLYAPEDINMDGDVNILDLSILLANFGKSGAEITVARADINGDGDVNVLDLSRLLAEFGK